MEPIPRESRSKLSVFSQVSPFAYSSTASRIPSPGDDPHNPTSFIAAWYLSASWPSTATCW
jgi:hypothetical protein